jgi:hypothetical protein
LDKAASEYQLNWPPPVPSPKIVAEVPSQIEATSAVGVDIDKSVFTTIGTRTLSQPVVGSVEVT